MLFSIALTKLNEVKSFNCYSDRVKTNFANSISLKKLIVADKLSMCDKTRKEMFIMLMFIRMTSF